MRRCTRRSCSWTTCRRIRDTSPWSTTCDRSWSFRCCSRIDASACSISKARSWRPSPSGMWTCCASWPARRRSPSTMRACTKRVRDAELRLEREIEFARRVQMALLPAELPRQSRGRRGRGPVRAGQPDRRRSVRFPVARSEHAGRCRRRCLGQGRAGRSVRRLRRRTGALAHLPAPLHAGSIQSGRRAGVDEHDSARARSWRHISARSATPCSISSGGC